MGGSAVLSGSSGVMARGGRGRRRLVRVDARSPDESSPWHAASRTNPEWQDHRRSEDRKRFAPTVILPL